MRLKNFVIIAHIVFAVALPPISLWAHGDGVLKQIQGVWYIVEQCVKKAKYDPGFNSESLTAIYGEESVKYLFIDGLKIFDTAVIYTKEGETFVLECSKEFPYWSEILFSNFEELKEYVLKVRSH